MSVATRKSLSPAHEGVGAGGLAEVGEEGLGAVAGGALVLREAGRVAGALVLGRLLEVRGALADGGEAFDEGLFLVPDGPGGCRRV